MYFYCLMCSHLVIQKQLEELLREGLYESADILGQSVVNSNTDHPGLLYTYAKVLLKKKEYSRSMEYFRILLNVLAKTSSTDSTSRVKVNAKLSIAKSLQKMRQEKEALKELLTIPPENRTIKVLLKLASLYRSQNYPTQARSLYKQILERNPLAVEAMIALSQLDVDGSSLGKSIDQRKIYSHLSSLKIGDEGKLDLLGNARIIHSIQDNLVRGHCAIVRSKFTEGLQYFNTIQQSVPTHLYALQQTAITYARRGNFEKSKYIFETIRSQDPLYVRSMDIYGQILLSEGKAMELNKLANDLLHADQYSPESWAVMAQYCELKSLKQDAAVFIDKAVTLAEDIRLDAYSYVVRGELQLSLSRPLPAVQSFKLAYASAKDFGVYKGLVQGYLELTKYEDALRFAKEAWAKIRTAQSLTLLGAVLMNTPIEDGKAKARKFLDKALSLDEYCFDAVIALVDLNISEEKFQEAIALLNKQKEREQKKVEHIHTKLGDIAVLSNSLAEAMMHYNAALQINPHFQQAIDGLEVLEKQLNRLKADDSDDEDLLSGSGSELDDSLESFM